MKKPSGCLLLVLLFLLSTSHARTETTFAGVLLSDRGQGLLAGNVQFTVRGGQVDFQSTLFQQMVSGGRLEPVLVVQNKVIPFEYVEGIPGRFGLGEFLGPIPGWDMTPICGWEFDVIDPGFELPWYADGVRFTGSFAAFPGLENLLRARSGTLCLQIEGEVVGLQDPLFSAPLVEGWPPRREHFTAELSGDAEVPPAPSAFSADASFSLTGNCLNYNLAWDRGLPWTSGGIFGPAGHHSTSMNLVADLSTPQRISFSGGPDSYERIIYHGAVSLSEDEVKQLKLGKLFVNLITAQHPGGEICGQILPVTREDRKMNPK